MTDATQRHLFCFGFGYSAAALANRLRAEGWRISGTARTHEKVAHLATEGIEGHFFDGETPVANSERVLSDVTHLLISAPPGASGDPVLIQHARDIVGMSQLEWVGYLSTTGVYGDTGGAWVDESSPLNPTAERSKRRAEAEAAWLEMHKGGGVPVHLFRLAGIYGPGRSTLDQVRAGRARRIEKPGHQFSRIHVEDIAGVLQASIAKPNPGAIYNVCDDEPAGPADVTAYACRLLDREPPPVTPFDEAKKDMSPMGLSFWADNRRVRNDRIKQELGYALAYPTYREGLKSLL